MQPLIGRGAVSGLALGRDAERVVEELHGAALTLFQISPAQRIGQVEQALQPSRTAHEQIPQMGTQGRDKILGVESLGEHLVEYLERAGIVPRQKSVHKAETVLVVKHVEIVHHILGTDVRAAEGHSLVEYGQRVAHRPVSLVGYDMQRLVVDADTLLSGDVAQIAHYVRDADALEVVGLAAAEYRRDYLVLLGGGEDEYGVCWRLLKRLEEGVERGLAQHMHLIDDIDRIASHLRRYLHLVHQGLDVLHAVIGGGIQLVYAVGTPLLERTARLALPAGFHIRTRSGAVDGLREDARRRSLADPARAAEKIGVGQLSPAYGVLESPGDIVLTYKGLETVRAILAGRYYII